MAAEPTSASSLFPEERTSSGGGASAQSSRFVVTARKYRPQTFGDMVGQMHVVRTLGNAIRLDRLAHAYLFSGPRGVGKTTAARILAKAVNCTTPLEERGGAEPCRECESCRTFEAARSLNIVEIDAASNNSVDDIRDLRDTVRIPPQGARMKIYILDEVHMLSKGAFNALLKTLEEPPPYVLFIFATTEPHKVLPTILSRTQRFDFRRISVREIMERLREICEAEGVEADDESLLLLARKADGALRDALSLFDQAVSLCGTPLVADALREALGVVDTDLLFDVTDGAVAGDGAGLFALVDRLMARGYDLPEFLGGLAEHLRNILVACATGQSDLIEEAEAVRERYRKAAAHLNEADVLHLLMIVEEAARAIRTSRHPRLTVELALLKMAKLESAADLQSVIESLNRLSTSPAAGTAEPGGGYQSRKPDSGRPESDPPKPVQVKPEDPRPEGEGGEDSSSDDDRDGEPTGSGPRTPTPSATTSGTPSATPSPPIDEGLFGSPALKVRRNPSGDGSGGPEASLAVAGDGAGVARSASASDLDASLGRVKTLWPKLVRTIKEERIHVGTLLEQAEPSRVVRGSIEVRVPDRFSRTLLESETVRFTTALTSLMEREAPRLRFVVDSSTNGEPVWDADPFERFKRLRHEHPVVQALFEKFDAEIVW